MSTEATARKVCEICNIRPVGGGISSGYEDIAFNKQRGFCNPCGDEGQMDINHTNGHESYPTEICWGCNPELDESQKEYTPRVGTSRAGMAITVPMRASGVEKAETVIAQLDTEVQNGRFTFKITKPVKRNGYVTKLTATSAQESFELKWDEAGRFTAGTVTENGKTRKIRNVAEALRLAA